MLRSQWMTFSHHKDGGFGFGEVGAEDALRLGVEVVGTIAEVVGEAKDGAVVGNEDVATGGVKGDALTAKVAQGGRVIDLTGGEGIVSPC